jgi:hypothetical protein
MWLKTINISRWGENVPLEGKVEFYGNAGNISFILSPTETNDLVKTLGDLLVKHTQAASKRMEVEAQKSVLLSIGIEPAVVGEA